MQKRIKLRLAEAIAAPENAEDMQIENFIGSCGGEIKVYKE